MPEWWGENIGRGMAPARVVVVGPITRQASCNWLTKNNTSLLQGEQENDENLDMTKRRTGKSENLDKDMNEMKFLGCGKREDCLAQYI